MAMNVEETKFVLENGVSTQNSSITLVTAGTYVDRNIEIQTNVADGAITAGVETTAGSANVAATGFAAAGAATDHYVTLSTQSGSAKGSATVVGEGWVDDADSKESTSAAVAVTGNGTKLYIPDSDMRVEATSTADPAVAISAAGTGFTASQSTTKYYVTANGKANNGTIKATTTITETGMVDKGSTYSSANVAVNPTVTGDGTKVYIPEADLKAEITGLTQPSVAVSGTAGGFTAAKGETDYFVTVNGAGTNGSVSAKASNAGTAAGMIDSDESASSAASTITPTINGSGTKVYIPEGSLGASVSGNITFTPAVSTSMTTIAKPSTGAEGTDYFAITGSGSKSGSVVGNASVATEGYVKGETATGGSATGTVAANDVKYVAKAGLSASGTASATTTVAPGDVSIGSGTGAIAGKEKLNIVPTTSTASIADYYIPIKASVAANSTGATSAISGTASAAVSTVGYAPATLTGSGAVSGTATAKTSAKSSSDYYISLAKTAYSNTVPTGMAESDFADISATAPALISGSYLYIKAGYNVNQKISLAQLVPDDATLVAGASDNIVSGQSAYDNDGKLITGSLNENAQSGKLTADASAASGYSYYTVSTTVGYNKAVRTTNIPVYQGDLITG